MLYDLEDILSYRNVFLTFQWISAFNATYKPVSIYIVECEHLISVYYLNRFGKIVNIGDPFNDFNSICVCNSYMSQLDKLSTKYDILISNHLEKISDVNISLTESYSVDLRDFESKLSKRIKKQYNKTLDYVEYTQITAAHPDFLDNLRWLLKHRQLNLLENKSDEINDSYRTDFNDLITNFCVLSKHSTVLRLDILKRKDTTNRLAMTLGFYAKDGAMCYLRAYDRRMISDISYGLVLDYYIMTNLKKNNLFTYDLTRGGEPYKARLGATKYRLLNTIICGTVKKS